MPSMQERKWILSDITTNYTVLFLHTENINLIYYFDDITFEHRL